MTSVPPTILVLASPQEQEDRGQHGDVEELGVICNIFVDNCNVVVFLLAMYEECRVQIGDREGPSLQKEATEMIMINCYHVISPAEEKA